MNQENKYNPLLRYLDKILVTIASLYLGLVLYWINQPKLTQPDSIVQAKETWTNVSNSQFIAYIKQSLKVIKATPLKTPSPQPSQNVPLERVYIPQYPPKPNKVTSVPLPPKPNKVASVPLPPKPSVTPRQADIILTGVLESGLNSAALFSFKGITKRLQTGDLVGSSGWTFQGVTQQKAVLSKGEQTRYIEVGQKL